MSRTVVFYISTLAVITISAQKFPFAPKFKILNQEGPFPLTGRHLFLVDMHFYRLAHQANLYVVYHTSWRTVTKNTTTRKRRSHLSASRDWFVNNEETCQHHQHHTNYYSSILICTYTHTHTHTKKISHSYCQWCSFIHNVWRRRQNGEEKGHSMKELNERDSLGCWT